MSLFDLFKKKKYELTEEQLKWNKMRDLWCKGKAASPYAELMTYQSEVNNGGHGQYFSNTENICDLHKEMAALEKILSKKLSENLMEAYISYLISEGKDYDEQAEATSIRCDTVFFENEEEFNLILEEYAKTITL